MDLLDCILSFTKDLLRMPNEHPLKARFEKAINDYSLQRFGRPIIRDATEEMNPAESTIQEIRNAAVTLFQEADRLEAIPGAKKLFSVRAQGKKDFLYIDKEEKAVRFWALQNPSDDRRIYEEWWIEDPAANNRKRCIKRIPMDVPTITARNQIAAEQGGK